MSQIMASLQRHLVRAIWVLLGSLLLTGAAGGAEPGLLNGGAGLSASVPRAYRVVNLPPGRYTGLTGFNTKDQFAISLVNEAGASRAYFHDGHSVRDIGMLGGSEAVVSGINDAG